MRLNFPIRCSGLIIALLGPDYARLIWLRPTLRENELTLVETDPHC